MPDLGQLAERTRFMREAGIALILCSIVLVGFMYVPLVPEKGETAAVADATSTPDAFASASPLAKSAVVYDLVTHEVLYAKNADAQLPLASLTKLLTIESALRTLPESSPVTIASEDEQVDTPKRFSVGDSLPLKDLARLTLTASLNDGASAIARVAAEHEGTSTPALLGATAAALGLSETYALNGSGLDVSTTMSGGYGSALDVAKLAGALVADAPDIALATTQSSASATTLTGKHYEIMNTNPTVGYAPRLMLSKTGYTDLAGGNLALVFDAGLDHPIAVVVLGSTEEARFTDVQMLVASTLAHFAGIASL